MGGGGMLIKAISVPKLNIMITLMNIDIVNAGCKIGDCMLHAKLAQLLAVPNSCAKTPRASRKGTWRG
jgi:hypothetical protein